MVYLEYIIVEVKDNIMLWLWIYMANHCKTYLFLMERNLV